MTDTATSAKAQRHLVSGRVQGVFFRASTRSQALALGVTGYARNLADGRVEIVAVGEPAALQTLQQWLRRGPPGANVVDLQTVDVDIVANEHRDFITL